MILFDEDGRGIGLAWGRPKEGTRVSAIRNGRGRTQQHPEGRFPMHIVNQVLWHWAFNQLVQVKAQKTHKVFELCRREL